MDVIWEEEMGVLFLLILGVKRLVILCGYLEFGSNYFLCLLEVVMIFVEIVFKFFGGVGILMVVDNRMGKKYEFEISEGGIVKVIDFKKVRK